MDLSDVLKSTAKDNAKKPLVSLLIDGDIVAYRAAAATDGRMYTIKGGDPNQAWKYKAEVVEHCKNHGIDKAYIELSFFPEPVAHAFKIVKQIMTGIKSNLATRFPNVQFIVYLTEEGNYRNSVGAGYKAGRKGLHRPDNLAPCKQFMKDQYGATATYGLEADDLLAIKATELGPGNCVVCSIDKDLKQIPGLHYNFVKDELEELTYAEGRKLLWIQVISGDTTDSIYSPRLLGEAAGKKLYLGVDFDTVKDETLFAMADQAYCSKLQKTNIDLSDTMCWVHEVYSQVYLLRTQKEVDDALKLMKEEHGEAI